MKIASDISQIVANNSMTGIAAVSSDLGNPLANHQLKSFLSLTAADGVYYNKSVNTLVVTKSGAVFDGIDFRGVAVVVRADDVTIKNSTFDASVGAYSINAVAGTKNLTVDHATFDGQKVDRLGFNVFLNSRGDNTTITNSAFIDAPTDAISIVSGNISGNYLAGAGYATGAHSDGIWIPMTTGAVVISDNVIDWRSTPDAKVATNNAVRITGEGGNVSDVTVKNNVILGGSYSVLVSDGATLTHSKDAVGSVTGVKVVGNVIDHGMYGTLEQTSRPKDMVYSDNMHASGRPVSPGTEAVGALPDLSSLNKITAASANAAINGTSKGDYILGGTGSNYIKGGAGDDVIVGGGGRDFITGGGGKDIFVYTSLKDDGLDRIMDFQQGQDRIDFATIAGAPKALTSWQWLGDESFTGNAWQVRYTQSSGVTTIELDADGDLKADFKLELAGKINLKTSDFILVDRADLAPKLTAANTSLSTKQSVGSSLAVSAPDGVLSHASHAATVSEAGGLSIGSVLKGLYGTLIMAADGSYTYTRAVGAVASGTVDSFGYKIVDAWGQTATAWLNVDLQDPNAAPTMTGAVSAAAIVEGSAGQHLRTGTLSFVDTDAGDTLTTSLSGQSVSVASGSGVDRTAWLSADQVAALKAGFTMPTGALGANAGEAGWSYALADGALDFLGRDDVARVVTTVQVSDGHGGVANQDVVVTLSGINDAPTFTTAPGRASVTETAGPTGSNALLTAQGSAGFADLDLTDAHTVAVSMQGRGFIGAMTASVVTDTTAGGAGRVVWNWSAPDKALDFLGAGQTLDQTYTLTLSDGKGGVVRQDVVVTLVGTDDLPSITGSTGATWYEGTAVNHARSGTLTFADADLTDHLTVSFAGQSVSYTSVSGADLTASLTADQVAALKAAFTMPTGDLGANRGTATWTYAIADKALDFIGQNDTVRVVTTVQGNDGNGGVAQQAVTIALKGVNDAPVIVAGGQVTGSVTEKAGAYGDASLHLTGGSFDFADIDLSDVHAVRVTSKGAGYLGALSATVSADTTGGGAGHVAWSFQVADKALDALAAGQSVTQTYAVQVGDGKSGFATQDVTVTLTGSADQFVFSGLTKKALPSFGAGDQLVFSASALGHQVGPGALAAEWFTEGTAATVSGHGQFVHDVAHKQLLWDADGTGGGAAVTVATFATPANLHAQDFFIV